MPKNAKYWEKNFNLSFLFSLFLYLPLSFSIFLSLKQKSLWSKYMRIFLRQELPKGTGKSIKTTSKWPFCIPKSLYPIFRSRTSFMCCVVAPQTTAKKKWNRCINACVFFHFSVYHHFGQTKCTEIQREWNVCVIWKNILHFVS